MKDYIPFEIQVEIIKKLPVKSLIQFRCVSKAWKCLIDSSDFIVDHSVHPTDPQHLLVRYEYFVYQSADVEKYVCFVDDGTSLRQTVSPTIPVFINKLLNPILVGSCHGLFYLFGSYYFEDDSDPIFVAVVWNPSIRKSFAVLFPYSRDWPLETRLGFGVCPGTSDPKIVKITQLKKWRELNSLPPCIPNQVKVFTLSSGAWRSPYSNLPRKSIEFIWSHVVIDGCIYWLAKDRILGSCESHNLIISFDLTSEEFKEVALPDCLAFDIYDDMVLSISKLREILVVIESFEYKFDGDEYGVWMMEGDDVSRSFTKRFTITPADASIKAVLGFRMSGEPLVKTQDKHDGLMGEAALAVYEPYSKRITDLGVHGIHYSFFANFYMQTLLLSITQNYRFILRVKMMIKNQLHMWSYMRHIHV